MITIEKLETITEKLAERIRSLNFNFNNPELQSEAEKARDEAAELIESFFELASQDWDENPGDDAQDDEETT